VRRDCAEVEVIHGMLTRCDPEHKAENIQQEQAKSYAADDFEGVHIGKK